MHNQIIDNTRFPCLKVFFRTSREPVFDPVPLVENDYAKRQTEHSSYLIKLLKAADCGLIQRGTLFPFCCSKMNWWMISVEDRKKCIGHINVESWRLQVSKVKTSNSPQHHVITRAIDTVIHEHIRCLCESSLWHRQQRSPNHPNPSHCIIHQHICYKDQLLWF